MTVVLVFAVEVVIEDVEIETIVVFFFKLKNK